jgi:hypothetical protein
MPRWIGVDGAGSWTIFSHRLQLFFSLAICSTLSWALTKSSSSLIS